MAKESGVGLTATIDDHSGSGQALTDDFTNIQVATPQNVQVITGLADTTEERLLLLRDASMTLNGVFDDASNMSHAVFKTVTTTGASRTSVFAHSGQTLTLEMMLTDYPLSRAADGSLTFAVPGVLANQTAFGWS